ncbi:MAG: DUF86 domain-containing protein [bacterium]|jgi:uncharacterized protein with HEPN domain|nr:DUF86 domain-containing protein [bacterium]
MSERPDKERIKDIITASANAIKYTGNISFEKFQNTQMIQDAVVRNIEIIGEAAKNISKTCRDRNPEIPWKSIMSVRDRLIHEYFGVNLDIVWTIIHQDLPDLIRQMKKALKKI